MKKKILIVGHDASRTGAPIILIHLAQTFKKNDFEILFLLGKGGVLLEEYEKIGKALIWDIDLSNKTLIQRIVFKLRGSIKRYQKGLIQEVKDFQPDLIFNNTIVNGLVVERLLTLNVKVFSMVHELESVIQMFNTQKEADKVFQYSDKIMAVSHAVKNNLIQNHQIPEEKIEVGYGFVKAIDTENHRKKSDDLREQLNIPKDAFVVGACGSLIFRKGFDFFVRVAQKYIAQHSNCYFIWIGGNKKSVTYIEVSQDLEKLGINNKVLFLGEQANPFDYYGIMNAFFMSSREDPFPLSMLEAGHFGLPMAGFKKAGGVEEFLANGGGFLAEYGDCDSVAKFFLELSAEPNLCSIYSDHIKTEIKKYDEEIGKNKYLNAVREMIQNTKQ